MAGAQLKEVLDALVAIFAAAAGSGVLGGSAEPLDPTVAHRCETADGVQLDPMDVLIAAALGHVRRDEYGRWHHYRPDGTEIGCRASLAVAGR